MKILTLSTILLLLLNQSSAQERGTRDRGQATHAATVREIKGTCYARKHGAAKPQKLKVDQRIEAGEELQCEAKSKVVIRFQNSGSIKEVTMASPNWYSVPNVPSSVVTTKAFKPASRSKGDLTPPLVQPIAASAASPATTTTNTFAAFDEVTDYWTIRQKYFLIIAVSPAEHYKTDEFTKTDANTLSATLKTFGYQELTVLKGQQPTQDNVVTALQKIRELGEDALVLVYYSGHAVSDGNDLWLQLAGQQVVGDHHGLSVSNLIGSARGDSFKGELAIVLDTCYSGQSLRTSRLSLQEIENTTIFASSGSHQHSFTKTLQSGVEISAFTYHLIQGLATDFAQVDGDKDGIVEYVDLQRYISNKLVEDYANKSIPGQMKPQMFGHAQRGWIAYDPKVVTNRNTEARRSLTLEINSTLQDPEKLGGNLPNPLPNDAGPYLKAVDALDDEDYERAWTLLQDAENEKKVSLAQINWARAYVKLGQGQPGPACVFIQRSVDLTRKPPQDLLLMAGGLHLLIGHLTKAEQFLKQGLAASAGNSTANGHVIDTLLLITIVNFFQGDRKDVELYTGQLRAIGRKALEEHEEGSSAMLNVIDVFTGLLSENNDSALQALLKLKSSLKPDEKWSSLLGTIIEVAEKALRSDAAAADTTPVAIPLTDKDLQEWRDALSKKDVAALSSVLVKVQMVASVSAGAKALASGEVKDLLKKSIDFTSKPRERKMTVTDASGTREIDIKKSPNADAMENGQILALIAHIHYAKYDFAEAESLYKQSIAVYRGLPGGSILALQSILGLSNLYQSHARREDATRLFRKLLDDFEEPLGESNWLSLMIHGELAEVYQANGQWDEAEASYRKSLELALTLFGSSALITDSCRNDLSEYLLNRGRYAEAAQLLEESIALLESRDTWPVMIRDWLGDGYFRLGKSYQFLQRLELSDAALIKALDFLAKKDDPTEAFECLHWRWATLERLKKTAQVQEVGKDLVTLVNVEISKSKPSAKLGAAVLTTAVWFRDSNEFSKAEELMQLGLKLQQKVYGLEAEQVAEIQLQLGHLASFKHSFGTAHKEFQIAEKMYRKINPVPSEILADALLHMGYASYQKQDFALSLTELQEALKFSGPQLNETISLRIAFAERALGQLGSARTRLLSLVHSKEPSDLDERLTQASIFLQLSAVSRLQNAGDETDKWLDRAETILAPAERVEAAPLVVRLQYERALREIDRGRLRHGEQLLKEAVEKGRTTPGLDWLVLADSMDRYAAFLRPRGKEKEASELEEEANRIRARLKL